MDLLNNKTRLRWFRLFKWWENKDWIWLTTILTALIIVIFTLWFNDIDPKNGFFSVLSSAVSIALAVVAIFIALKQDSDSTRINHRTESLLKEINQKINGLNDNLNQIRIEQNTSSNKKPDDYDLPISGGKVASRMHGIISTNSNWKGMDFVNTMAKVLADKYAGASIIDYSIITLESDSSLEYSKLINIIINREINEEQLKELLISTLNNMKSDYKKHQIYYNPRISIK